MTSEEVELKLEEIRQQGETNRQTARLTFWSSILTSFFGVITAVCGIATPIILRSYHIETVDKVNTVQKEAKEVITSATAKIDEKVDANLAQWKAYNSKDPDDMNKAAEALKSAEAIPNII